MKLRDCSHFWDESFQIEYFSVIRFGDIRVFFQLNGEVMIAVEYCRILTGFSLKNLSFHPRSVATNCVTFAPLPDFGTPQLYFPRSVPSLATSRESEPE